jgi:hypothetical protein
VGEALLSLQVAPFPLGLILTIISLSELIGKTKVGRVANLSLQGGQISNFSKSQIALAGRKRKSAKSGDLPIPQERFVTY